MLALNDHIVYVGLDGEFESAGVTFLTNGTNTTYWPAFQTGPGYLPPDTNVGWSDIQWDYQTNYIYGGVSWNSMKNVFSFASLTAPKYNWVLNFSICTQCDLWSSSPMSALDVPNQLFYTVEQTIPFGETTLYTIDLQTNSIANQAANAALGGLWELDYSPDTKIMYGYLVNFNETSVGTTEIISINPQTAKFTTISVVDVPSNFVITSDYLGVPEFVDFNVNTQTCYALYIAYDAPTNSNYYLLYTIDMNTGKLIYSTQLQDSWKADAAGIEYPWMLTSMDYYTSQK